MRVKDENKFSAADHGRDKSRLFLLLLFLILLLISYELLLFPFGGEDVWPGSG